MMDALSLSCHQRAQRGEKRCLEKRKMLNLNSHSKSNLDFTLRFKLHEIFYEEI